MQRVARIIINSDIVRATSWLGYPLQDDFRVLPEYTYAQRVSRNLVEDIVASVPAFLGNTSFLTSPQSPSTYGDNEIGIFARALFIVWPLFMTKCSDFSSLRQRKWISGRLRYIANDLQIREASMYSKVYFVSLTGDRLLIYLQRWICNCHLWQFKRIDLLALMASRKRRRFVSQWKETARQILTTNLCKLWLRFLDMKRLILWWKVQHTSKVTHRNCCHDYCRILWYRLQHHDIERQGYCLH